MKHTSMVYYNPNQKTYMQAHQVAIKPVQKRWTYYKIVDYYVVYKNYNLLRILTSL